MIQFFGISILVFALSPTLAVSIDSQGSRPFHLGIHKLSPAVDSVKELGVADHAGWALVGDYLIGSTDAQNLSAINKDTRQILWTIGLLSSQTSRVASIGNQIGFSTRDGKVHMYDLTSGKLNWATQLDSFSQLAPVFEAKYMLVQTVAQSIYALDIQKGEVLWVFDTGFPDGLSIVDTAQPIVANGLVYAGTADGSVYGIQLNTGKLVWKLGPSHMDREFRDVVGSMVLKGANLILARFNGEITMIDVQDFHGKELESNIEPKKIWEEKRPLTTLMVERNGQLFLGGAGGDVVCMDANSGRQVWRITVGSSISAIVPTENNLIITTSDGKVLALETPKNSTEPRILWTDFLEGNIVQAPIITKENMHVISSLKVLYAYRL